MSCFQKLFFLGIYLLSDLFAFSQSNQNQPDIKLDMIPASPNVASFAQHGNIPVAYYTGMTSVAIPIYTVVQGDLKLPISLAYNSRGFKPKENPSWVGLGWNLNVGGVITRIVKDDIDGSKQGGFGDPNFDTDVYQYNYQYNSTENDMYDLEPDIFIYNFGGYSGKFIYKGNTPVILNSDKLKIEQTGTGIELTFKITDPLGNAYYFEDAEKSNVLGSKKGSLFYVSSLQLTKIESASGQDVLRFYYEDERIVENQSGSSESFTHTLLNTDNVPEGNSPLLETSSQNTFAKTIISSKRLVRIETLNHRVEFVPYSTVRLDQEEVGTSMGSTNKALYDIKVFSSQTNKLIKHVRFDSEYFGTGSGSNKLLKLKSVYDLSPTSTVINKHIFHYNYESDPVPDRNTMAIDYWGFFNGQLSNASLFPKAILARYMKVTVSAATPESKRSPSFRHTSMFMLNKIEYPTGGHTAFTFEQNAYKPNYFENPWPEFTQSQFYKEVNYPGTGPSVVESQALTVTHRQTISLKYARLFNHCDNIRIIDNVSAIVVKDAAGTVVYDSGHPIACGENFLSLTLEPGTYSFTVATPSNASKTYCSFSYLTADHSAFGVAPGVRIKTIISTPADGNGKEIKKEYSYVDVNSQSTGALIFNEPFMVTRFESECNPPQSGHCFCTQFSLVTSKPPSLSGTDDYFFMYKEVTEKNIGLSETFETVYKYAFDYHDKYQSLDQIVNLDEQIIYKNLPNNQKKPQKKIKTHYTTSAEQFFRGYNSFSERYITNQESDPNANCLGLSCYNIQGVPSCGVFRTTDYVFERTWKRLQYSEEYLYEENGTLVTRKDYVYDPATYLLKAEKETNSKAEQVTRKFKYAEDYSTSISFINGLLYKNMKGTLLEQQVWLKKDANTPDLFLSGKVMSYDVAHLKPLKEYYFNAKSTVTAPDQESTDANGKFTTVISDSRYEPRVEFNYSPQSRLTSAKKIGDAELAIIWGYKNSVPIAKVVGANYSACMAILDQTILDNPSSPSGLLIELNKLRTQLPGKVLVSTMAHDPLVGVVTECDPKNQCIYYEYDAFGRLYLVRDQNNRILKKYCYNFHGQPEDCAPGCINTTANWQEISTVCDGQNNGNQVITERDINTCSPTYNQTRTQTVYNPTACPLPSCNTSNCSGADKKCINGTCETGVKVCTATTGGRGNWVTTYHYEWSDGSRSPDYTEPGLCLIQ